MRLVFIDRLFRGSICGLLTVTILTAGAGVAGAQTVDCGRLRQQIADIDQAGGGGGGGRRYAAAAHKQAIELARTQAYAHQLGCENGFSFFGGNPQCGALTQRMQQMQANLGQLQAGGSGGQRGDLVARFNAYCRGAQPPRQRGFFESIFGGGHDDPQQQPPLPDLPPDPNADDDGETAHGGSQAVCVRSCDGGFFPLGISSHHSSEDLTQMCQALCPGTDVAVYTRSPDAEIKTAVGLDGKPYVDMPNAMKFQKTFVPQCSCRPEGKSWAETLANADDVLGNTHKGDIMVTPEKSAEMSRPKLDPKTKASLLQTPAAVTTAQAGDGSAGTIADGVKRPVRQVGPQP